MKVTILTFCFLLFTPIAIAQIVFDNKHEGYIIRNEAVSEANPHLFTDRPFYGYNHFSFRCSKREIFSDTAIDKRHPVKGEFVFWLSVHEGKGVYRIDLREISGSSVKDRLISSGEVRIRDNVCQYIDKKNGACLESSYYCYDGGYVLSFNKAFPHFKRKAFDRDELLNLASVIDSVDSKLVSTILQSAGFKLPTHKLTFGLYQTDDETLSLLLNRDDTYRYYVCGLLFSEGTWKQKGQRIDLYDRHLSHTFYCKLTDKGVLSGYLPGDQEGALLKRFEEKKDLIKCSLLHP